MQKDGFLLGFDTFQSTVDGFWVKLKGLAVDQIMVLMLSVLVYQDPLVLRDLFLDVSDVLVNQIVPSDHLPMLVLCGFSSY